MYYVETIMTRLQNTKSKNLYFLEKKLFLIDRDRLNTVIFLQIIFNVCTLAYKLSKLSKF